MAAAAWGEIVSVLTMDACPAYRGGSGAAGPAARPAVAAEELGCGLLDGERPGVNDLLAHGSFPGDRSVFEPGCGTGRLAGSLLASHLPADARYLGADISDNGGPEQNAPSAVRPPRRGDPGVDGTRPLPTAGGRFDRFLAQGEGAKMAVNAAAAASAHSICPVAAVASISGRSVVTGLRSAAARSQDGMVCGLTKILLLNVNGNRSAQPALMTALGVHRISPSVIQAHDRPDATHHQPTATPAAPPPGWKPMARPAAMTRAEASR